MLSAYFSKGCDSRELFKDLKIAKDPSFEKNLNKFNVIKLDVNAVFSANPPDTDIVPVFTAKIRKELQQQFPNVGIEDGDIMPDCIEKVYAATGEQFIIIMDEYDVLVREKVKEPIFKSYLAFLNAMFKNADLAPAIALAYLTGILPIVRDKEQSKLNVFKEYTMAGSGRLAEFVGFTADEVQALCREHNVNFEECKRWYDGYNINGIEIYNPKSIVEAVDSSEIESYWTQTGSYEALKNYILMDFEGILQDVKFMIGGGRVDVDVDFYLNTMVDFHSKDDVFAYLIHLGYLAYDRTEKQCYIPNREVREQWIASIRNAPDYKGVMELVNASKQLIQSTVEMESEAVAAALDKAHEQICNNLNYNNEGTFQAVICLAYFYANLKYTIIKECPAGKGIADVILIPYVPNVPALIIELKRNKCEQTALTQIREKNYGAALEKFVK
ncbi:AAA family ATPase [Fibrobacter sp.]|uniref:AAA family ATPase n=1 Tax=Fibrobacter sp. TaxID=35828 RepID=UPI0025BD0469|nr:AAA family ATPase [Fibrobacter sp.]MBR3072032.1 AAA family ATPase [Fibrobacter sp.]